MHVSMLEGMYVLPCADDVQPNYGKVPCAFVAIRRVSHNTVCMYIRMYLCKKECVCYHVQIMSNPIMGRFYVQGCVGAQPRSCYHGQNIMYFESWIGIVLDDAVQNGHVVERAQLRDYSSNLGSTKSFGIELSPWNCSRFNNVSILSRGFGFLMSMIR